MIKLTLALILIGFIYVPPGQPQAPPPVLEFTIPMQPVETENSALLCPCVAA